MEAQELWFWQVSYKNVSQTTNALFAVLTQCDVMLTHGGVHEPTSTAPVLAGLALTALLGVLTSTSLPLGVVTVTLSSAAAEANIRVDAAAIDRPHVA